MTTIEQSVSRGAGLDLNKLLHAATVAREGSLVAAARSIPMSQSALTRSLQALERQYGIRLFERGKNGTKLTAEGADFVAAAEEILWAAERAEDRLIAVANEQSVTVRVGVGPLVSAGVLPAALPELAELGVRFEFHAGNNRVLRQLLSRGEIDFFLGGAPPGTNYFTTASGLEFHSREKYVDSLFVFVRPGHPVIGTDLGPSILAQYPVACESVARVRIGPNSLTDYGIPAPSIELDDYNALIQLALRTDFMLLGMAAVRSIPSPERLVMLSPPLLGSLRTWNWGVVSSERAPLTASARSVAEVLKRHLDAIVEQ